MTFSLADKLYANKPYEDTVEVLGRKFTFVPLSHRDEVEIAGLAGSNSFLQYSESRKIPTLARCIKKIDGQSWEQSSEIQQLLRSNPKMTPVKALEQELSKEAYTSQVIDAIYVAYSSFRSKYIQQVHALKKSSDEATVEPVGSSVKP